MNSTGVVSGRALAEPRNAAHEQRRDDVSLDHSPENPEIVEHYLRGLQYVLGDLEADDASDR